MAVGLKRSDRPAAAAKLGIFHPELDDRNADEVILCRMRQLANPATYPAFAAADLVISICKAKIDQAMAVLRGKIKGDARDELEDAAYWMLEVADLEQTPSQIADVLELVALRNIDRVNQFAHTKKLRGRPRKPKN